MNEVPEIMTVDEVSEYLRVNRKNIPKLIENGLPYFTTNGQENGHKRFKKSEVDKWIEEN